MPPSGTSPRPSASCRRNLALLPSSANGLPLWRLKPAIRTIGTSTTSSPSCWSETRRRMRVSWFLGIRLPLCHE